MMLEGSVGGKREITKGEGRDTMPITDFAKFTGLCRSLTFKERCTITRIKVLNQNCLIL